MPFQLLRKAFARPRRSRRGARSQTLPCRELRRAPFIYLGRDVFTYGTLFLEQLPLALESPAISAELATLPYDAMTRNHDGGLIVRARACHRTHRFGRPDCAGDLAVRSRLAERNLLQL